MITKFDDKNLISTLILVIAAIILLLLAYMTKRNDLITAMVIVSAIILFLTAIFLYSFSTEDLLSSELLSLLHVQGTINLCRIATDLGIMGQAVFIPESYGMNDKTMQFLPVTEYKKGNLSGDSFVSGSAGTGLLMHPQGKPLKDYLTSHSSLKIPHDENEIFSLIKETGVEILELADKINVSKTGEGYTITFLNFQLFSGCQAIQNESPACCLINPCPICSLFGVILAEGLNKPITLEHCTLEKSKKKIEILYIPIS
ncbi:MAG: hypothetical protein GXY48_12585 [Methanomicrobiales archaeon]|nr:hypothetical protein [Methanomicrobiales archaeon]